MVDLPIPRSRGPEVTAVPDSVKQTARSLHRGARLFPLTASLMAALAVAGVVLQIAGVH